MPKKQKTSLSNRRRASLRKPVKDDGLFWSAKVENCLPLQPFPLDYSKLLHGVVVEILNLRRKRTCQRLQNKELVDRIAGNNGVNQTTAKKVIQCFLDEITTEIAKGNRIEFRDFGVFEVRKTAPRMARNPKTLKPVEVPAKRTVKFKTGRLMKEKLRSIAQP